LLETEEAYLHPSLPGISERRGRGADRDAILADNAGAQRDESEDRWLRRERPWGNWARKTELPKEIDPRDRSDVRERDAHDHGAEGGHRPARSDPSALPLAVRFACPVRLTALSVSH
jgi:hypothetical protein